MEIPMKWGTVFLSLLAVACFGTWHKFLDIKVSQSTTTINSHAGATLTFDVKDYFSGFVSTHNLKADNPNLEISKLGNKYEVKIPKKLRGYHFNITLNAENLLDKASVSIAFSTTFIGKVNDIALASSSACIQDEYGLFCWGEDNAGQSTDLPSSVSSKATLYGGGNHFCALDNDRLACWGDVSIDIKMRNLTTISSGSGGVCYVDMGRLHCHASRSASALSRNIPFENEHIMELAVGGSHACLMDTARKIKCWGGNINKQTIVPNDLIYPKNLISGSGYSCVLDIGKIRCWGIEDIEINQPELQEIKDIAANGSRLCAEDINGWHCWDITMAYDNRYKYSTYANKERIIVSRFGVCSISKGILTCDGLQFEIPYTIKQPSSLTQSGHTACFIDDGKIECIGTSSGAFEKFQKLEKHKPPKKFEFYASFGNGCATYDTGDIKCVGRRSVERIQNAKATHFGVHNSVCSSNKANIFCWGENAQYKLENPPTLAQIDKIRVTGTRKTDFACALANSQVKCWGDDNKHQSHAPYIDKVIDFDISGEAGCVATKTKLTCWGEKDHLPDEYATDFTHINSVALKDRSLCVNDNGKAKCWGGRRNDRVPSWLHGIKELTTGMIQSCAIDSGGITCWGDRYLRYGLSNI